MSGFYIDPSGKVRKTKGGYIGVDGVARKNKKGYIGDANGVARLCWIAFEADPVFANNSWENIALACQLKEVPDDWSVGDQKTMTINGSEYVIDIIGKNHDDYADGSGKAPLTFQLHDCYGNKYSMNSINSNAGGWRECEVRTIHLPSILALMPLKVQNAIREVSKRTGLGNNNTKIDVTNDKLFLPSEPEVYGSATYSLLDEGVQYEYYKNFANMKKSYNGSTSSWQLRSPHKWNSQTFSISGLDFYVGTQYGDSTVAMSFAFCF